uniref:RNA helicase n=1 Tax=Romanomermis culicivorax TaxID=13658 RepID=A0A915K2P9_ROMCU
MKNLDYQQYLNTDICLQLEAIAELGWKKPTLIQEHAIPLALEGKDILARACTGSGKTAAFAIPILQKVLDRKKATGTQSIRGLILAPTRELSSQICEHIKKLCSFCSREIRCIDLAVQAEAEAQKPILTTLPDIIVGTPNRLLIHLQANTICLKDSLEFLVVDEADLVLSFGYEDEMKQLVEYLPENVQSFLTSATLDDNVTLLKKLFLHNPVTLRLQETSLPSPNQLFQYHIMCEEEDKFVLIYALLKLRLVKGRSIIFVNTVDRCYR